MQVYIVNVKYYRYLLVTFSEVLMYHMINVGKNILFNIPILVLFKKIKVCFSTHLIRFCNCARCVAKHTKVCFHKKGVFSGTPCDI